MFKNIKKLQAKDLWSIKPGFFFDISTTPLSQINNCSESPNMLHKKLAEIVMLFIIDDNFLGRLKYIIYSMTILCSIYITFFPTVAWQAQFPIHTSIVLVFLNETSTTVHRHIFPSNTIYSWVSDKFIQNYRIIAQQWECGLPSVGCKLKNFLDFSYELKQN